MSHHHRNPVHSLAGPVEHCSLDLRRKLIRESPFFSNLEPGQIDEINSRFRDVGFSANKTILREGDNADSLFIVATGLVKLYSASGDGGILLIDILKPGEHFGSVAGFGPECYEETAVAAMDCCLLKISSENFHRVLTMHPQVAVRTVEILSHRVRFSHELMRRLGSYSAENRSAWLLLRLGEKLGRPWEGKNLINAPVSREELAAMIGITTETASRIVSRFQKKGLIESGRGWIAIKDPEGLKKLTEDVFD
ncbi:hypothetical protein B4O97_01135 [Marispirochaeta aestuarii]|uniref:Crp/Fnr family transcriptional regulator n=1 Tax=Marispirochaeta aestuarii TaxID=1963862 RepID=A0A1Y1S335_9SPIO|nr:Crp/Fnr family transcriptional regulator [Marispirochaeta aestuarii]ORC38390.1 hypothetical protein B4O97_01135 [Marispirochaeta aestuarii]